MSTNIPRFALPSLAAVAIAFGITTAGARVDALACDLARYKAAQGLIAAVEQDLLVVTWNGQAGAELRARYAIDGGRPVIRDLGIRQTGGQWQTLGRNLVPEYRVTSGVRRMSEQQAQPLREAHVELTSDVIDKNRWYAFWDAPLVMPDGPEMRELQARRAGQAPPAARVLGPSRTPEEIRRASASFNANSCGVTTDGASLEVMFPGLSMGIFSGSLRFTAYRGTNLLRMDAIARTGEPWVAYKYEAGLKGFTTDLTPRVVWHDTGGHPQRYEFGGVANDTIVPLKAANRVLIAEGPGGSVAAFPPPHTFFFTREVDTNLGYVWYRKDADGRFAVGIRQADREENPQYVENFALFNAPPGTWQHMGVYFFVSADAGEPGRQAALAFTHGDAFKPLPGYKTMVNHFHLRFTERVRASGSFDTPMQDLAAMRALGLNVVGLSDFHGDLHPTDPGPIRFKDQADYAEASRRASDKDFLVTPWEEPSAYFGGHYNILFPKNVSWSKVRRPGQPFEETDTTYGKVYHAGSSEDVQKILDAEGAYWYHAHPRTKGTTGYPDLIFDKAWTKSDRYLGVAFKPGMGMDLSEQRLCDWRCFDAADTMNNLYAGSGLMPKYIIADIDTYQKGPEDDLYPNFPVNYLKLDKVPGPDDDWSSVLRALRQGDFFVTTGEILIPRYGIEGTGARRTIVADVEWTFPLSFVEIVWGDGKTIARQIIPATDLGPFGTKRFSIPFDAAGKAWVRFAVWDSAGNGAFVQPVWLNAVGAGQALPGKPSLYLIGDSTVKVGTLGQVGWGERIDDYFDPARISVVNAARGGRSSRTYVTEGLWDRVLIDLKRGDTVVMQFGHNDGSPLFTGDRPRGSIKGTGEEIESGTVEMTGKAETVHTFGWYLRKFIADAKAKGATPIVCSPIPRNEWKDGRIVRDPYATWSRDAAVAEGVPFIDLNEITARRYEEMGPEKVQPLFPNDHTHTNAAGADINAASVIAGLKGLPACRLCEDLSSKADAVAPWPRREK